MDNNALSEILEKRRAKRRLPEPRVRRLVREQSGLSQADLARVLGVDQATVCRWESGERDPRPAQLVTYVAALDRLAREGLSP